MTQRIRLVWRSLIAQPFYTAVTLTSLSIGLAAVLVISLWVIDEKSFDLFYPESENIFRVITQGHFGDNHWTMPYGPAPLAEALKSGSPSVAAATRISRSSASISVKDRPFLVEDTFLVDVEACDVFGIKMIQGRCDGVFNSPDRIILSESTVQRLFGQVSVVGETVLLNGRTPMQVAGIFEDWPKNAHMQPEAFVSSVHAGWANTTGWTQNPVFTYLRLRSAQDKPVAETYLDTLNSRHVIASLKGNRELSASFAAGEISNRFYLQSIQDIHLDEDVPDSFHSGGSLMVIGIFSLAALLILVLATVNFVSMTTATGAMRAKEIGIRKVLGSNRGQLVSRFLLEALVLTLISGVLSVLLAWAAINMGGGILHKPQLTQMLVHPFTLIGLFFACCTLAVAAGLYPALSMSAAPALSVIKGNLHGSFDTSRLRAVLLCTQMVVATVLLAGTWTIERQLCYMMGRDLGFDKENVLVIQGASSLGSQRSSFENEIRRIYGVKSASATGNIPGSGYDSMPFFDVNQGPSTMTSIDYITVDPEYVATLGMELIEGREFQHGVATDSVSYIVNEALVQLMGWTDGIQGKQLSWGDQSGAVIGLVKNFATSSLQGNFDPLVIMHNRWQANIILVRVEPGALRETLASVQSLWERFQPARPFQFVFLDQSIMAQYRQEQQLVLLLAVFSILSMIIIVLGLVSLMAHIILRKTREIGIRKVLGARFDQLAGVLAKRLVDQWAIATIIAIPLAYFLQKNWLEQYAYRISIDWSLLVLPSLVVGILLFATVSFQIWKAIRVNPVESLRSE